MFGKKGKPIKKGDQPTRQKGMQKAPSQPQGGEVKNGKQPGGTRGNKNLPR